MEQSLVIAQLLFKYGPEVAASVAALFGKEKITAEDWAEVFARARTPFDQGLTEEARNAMRLAAQAEQGLRESQGLVEPHKLNMDGAIPSPATS